jgi:CheY-like chemotaxis protein
MSDEPFVLYAEDDENDAFFMQRAFAMLKRPKALRIVRDGAEAIEYLRGVGEFSDRTKHPFPSLVVLDVKMPRMSGLEVLQRLRADPTIARVPVVMFTSSTQDSDIEVSRARGADAYLVKPSNSEQLAVLMGDLVEAAKSVLNRRSLLGVRGNRLAPSPPK